MSEETEDVREKIFRPKHWHQAEFDASGKLHVSALADDKIKYFAAVYPTGRVAIKIPVEANLSIDALPEVVAELALINFNMRVIQNQNEKPASET